MSCAAPDAKKAKQTKYEERSYVVPYGHPTKRVTYVDPTPTSHGGVEEIMRQVAGLKITLHKADIWERLFDIGNEMPLSCTKK